MQNDDTQQQAFAPAAQQPYAAIQSGKRNTIQRQMIFAALCDLDIHATAEQIYDRVSVQYPSISKATVYRNLAQMAESGEILNVGNFNDGAVHYDHRLDKHYHFACDACGRVFDVSTDLGEICGKMTGLDGHEVKNHSLTFSGVCRDCLKKE